MPRQQQLGQLFEERLGDDYPMADVRGTSHARLPSSTAIGLLVVAILVLAAGLTLANYRYAANSPGGNDFIPRWLGTRLLLAKGQNPYGAETSLAIQEFMYGRPAKANEDQVLFVYPLYSALLFAPFALVGDYVVARALWMTALEMALLALAIVSLRLANWRPAAPVLVLVLLFTLSWYHGVRPLINGNAAILVALFVATALLSIRLNRDVTAGLFLALSTVKPQAVVLLLPLVLIWAFSRRRYRIVFSTLICLALLFILSTLIEPGWLSQNIHQVVAYPDYTLAGTPAAIFEIWWPSSGRWLGLATTTVLAILLLQQWRSTLSRDAFVLVPIAFFTLAITNLIGVTTAASNYIALLPGVIILLAFWRRDKGTFREWPAVLAMILLFVGLWMLFWFSRSGRAQSPVMFFPVPLILITVLPLLKRASIHPDSTA
ncbi:MAG: DUF2029 domain-containing protein [Chloroflexota bacterium]|nr:MAG: DUF2029 domain-containing protein [Chloroflexota bacterium]